MRNKILIKKKIDKHFFYYSNTGKIDFMNNFNEFDHACLNGKINLNFLILSVTNTNTNKNSCFLCLIKRTTPGNLERYV